MAFEKMKLTQLQYSNTLHSKVIFKKHKLTELACLISAEVLKNINPNKKNMS